MTAQNLEETLSVEAAREAIASGSATALDIRDDEEWAEMRIAGATRLPEDEVVDRIDELPEDAAIVVVCSDGKRSAKVAAKLREQGREAASMEGGIEKWRDERLPLQPRPDEEFEGPDYTQAGPTG